MTIEALRTMLGWGFLLNMGLILWWFLFLVFAGDWVFRMHGNFIKISREQFNGIHYAGLAFFKVLVFVLYGVPYVVLWIVK